MSLLIGLEILIIYSFILIPADEVRSSETAALEGLECFGDNKLIVVTGEGVGVTSNSF